VDPAVDPPQDPAVDPPQDPAVDLVVDLVVDPAVSIMFLVINDFDPLNIRIKTIYH
jgi:hypothetical protein